MDSAAPPFSLDDPFYIDQLSKDMTVNVYKDGKWGTYRHTLLDANKKIQSPHMYLSWLTRGDLSSLTWLEGRLSRPRLLKEIKDQKKLIYTEYAALNFRDIMLATAKLAPEVVVSNRIELVKRSSPYLVSHKKPEFQQNFIFRCAEARTFNSYLLTLSVFKLLNLRLYDDGYQKPPSH